MSVIPIITFKAGICEIDVLIFPISLPELVDLGKPNADSISIPTDLTRSRLRPGQVTYTSTLKMVSMDYNYSSERTCNF